MKEQNFECSYSGLPLQLHIQFTAPSLIYFSEIAKHNTIIRNIFMKTFFLTRCSFVLFSEHRGVCPTLQFHRTPL